MLIVVSGNFPLGFWGTSTGTAVKSIIESNPDKFPVPSKQGGILLGF